jgi:hypothetical protein
MATPTRPNPMSTPPNTINGPGVGHRSPVGRRTRAINSTACTPTNTQPIVERRDSELVVSSVMGQSRGVVGRER